MPPSSPHSLDGCTLLILLTQLLHQDPLPSSHSLGDTRAPSRCAIVVFKSFFPWSHTDFPGFRTIACALQVVGEGGVCVVPRSSPRTPITEEALPKRWSFIQTQKAFLEWHVLMNSSGGSSTNLLLHRRWIMQVKPKELDVLESEPQSTFFTIKLASLSLIKSASWLDFSSSESQEIPRRLEVRSVIPK